MQGITRHQAPAEAGPPPAFPATPELCQQATRQRAPTAQQVQHYRNVNVYPLNEVKGQGEAMLSGCRLLCCQWG